MLAGAARRFRDDHQTDRAAALTYYAALSIFPGAIVLVALLKIFGSADTVDQLLKGVDAITPGGASDTLRSSINDLVRDSQGAGFALVAGLATALWTASAYVSGLLRAHRVIARADEPKGWLRDRATQLGLTAALIVAMAAALLVILASGPVAKGLGAVFGVEDAAVTVWKIAKWPALLLVGVVMQSLIRHVAIGRWSRRRLVSVGSVAGALVWVIASAGFAIYVSHFARFDQTYRSLTAAIVFLVWLWVSNAALLFGAEVDAEVASRENEPVSP